MAAFIYGMFKIPSPLAGKIWYTDNTEQGTVRKADAVAIAADMATASSCDTPVSKREDICEVAAQSSRHYFIAPNPGYLRPY